MLSSPLNTVLPKGLVNGEKVCQSIVAKRSDLVVLWSEFGPFGETWSENCTISHPKVLPRVLKQR